MGGLIRPAVLGTGHVCVEGGAAGIGGRKIRGEGLGQTWRIEHGRKNLEAVSFQRRDP